MAKEKENVEQSEFITMNMKRTADEYQGVQLDLMRQLNAQTVAQMAVQNNMANQIVQNGIENGNLACKAALKHADLAADRIWNVDEQGFTVADILNDSKYQDMVAAVAVKVVADMAATK